jgi:hypothetical protein
MCDEFFYRTRNYHNDKAASKELGFGDTVIGGRMTLSCVTELLTRHFGRGFYYYCVRKYVTRHHPHSGERPHDRQGSRCSSARARSS